MSRIFHNTLWAICLCILLPVHVTPLRAQNNACLDDIRMKYNQMLGAGNLSSKTGSAFSMNYKVRTATVDSARDGISETQIQVWAEGGNLEIRSEQMEVYQDARDVFIVLPQKKLVLRNDRTAYEKAGKRNLDKMRFIQDTVFTLGRVTECRQVGEEQVTVLELRPEGRQYTGLRRIVFTTAKADNNFRTIRLEYEPGGENRGLVWIEYRIIEVSRGSSGRRPASDASTLIFEKGSILKKKYSGYELVDNRYKKNKEAIHQLK